MFTVYTFTHGEIITVAAVDEARLDAAEMGKLLAKLELATEGEIVEE